MANDNAASAQKGQKTIASAANLSNLLPTGTVLAFQALVPSFSNSGSCHPSNTWLTISVIAICATICFFTSFTDSFIDETDKKFYYGFVTGKGIYVLNPKKGTNPHKIDDNYKRKPLDFFHSFLSLTVFLVFALSDLKVKNCFFPDGGENLTQLVINLPLGAAVFASFLFTIFPSNRRGIGFTFPSEKSKNAVEEKELEQTGPPSSV